MGRRKEGGTDIEGQNGIRKKRQIFQGRVIIGRWDAELKKKQKKGASITK